MTIRTLLTTFLATIAGTTLAVAVVPGHAAPAAPARTALALTSSGELHTFPLDHPDRTTALGRIEGLVVDNELVGIDVRPADGLVYGVGDEGGIYQLRLETAPLVTLVGRFDQTLQDRRYGVDVNPAADAIRVVGDGGDNLRYSFASAATSAGTPAADDSLHRVDPATGADRRANGVVSAAYTNIDTSGSTGTTLYVVDAITDRLALLVPPARGVVTDQGRLATKVRGRVGFDIATTTRRGAATDNQGYLVATARGVSRLHRVDLTTGRTSPVGAFTTETDVVDLAVLPA